MGDGLKGPGLGVKPSLSFGSTMQTFLKLSFFPHNMSCSLYLQSWLYCQDP